MEFCNFARAARRGFGGLRGSAVVEYSLAWAWLWVVSPAPKTKTKWRGVGKCFSWQVNGGGIRDGKWQLHLMTLYFWAYYLALRSSGGLVITAALWDTVVPSGLGLERCHAWYSAGPIKKLPKSALHQSRMNSPGNVHCQRGVAFSEFLKLAFWICWIE